MKKLNLKGLNEERKWDYENGYYWFSSPARINKLLAHYELYKMILDKPGDVLEFGVFKATSLIRFLSFRDAMENSHSRKIIGFDTFESFPLEHLSLNSDYDFIQEFEQNSGEGLSKNEIEKVVENKGFSNYELVRGNVFDSLPVFIESNPSLRISLLHLDMDVKEPTEYALKLLYDRVVPGGIIVFDDYSSVEGATIVVDEFCHKYNLELRKLPFYSVPSFITK